SEIKMKQKENITRQTFMMIRQAGRQTDQSVRECVYATTRAAQKFQNNKRISEYPSHIGELEKTRIYKNVDWETSLKVQPSVTTTLDAAPTAAAPANPIVLMQVPTFIVFATRKPI
ncbi:hypothetical protein DOY81_009180, partial [Sarcophaga bullata]